MNKIVVYTCCVGNYDVLQQPKVVNPLFDYICFSDNIKKSYDGVWEIRPIPFVHKEKTRISRYAKLLPHLVLKEYEYSVYLDANLQIIDDEFYNILMHKIDMGCLIAQVNHDVPPVDCTYDELVHAYRDSKASFLQVLKMSIYLKKAGFPRHYGLFENNIIYRKHGDESVIAISNYWWNEYLKHAPRDQFSLMFVYWQTNYKPDLLFGEGICTRNCDYLCYNKHVHEQKKVQIVTKISIKLHRYTSFIMDLLI